MRRCAFTVCIFVLLVGQSSPAQAVPILDIQGLENLELTGPEYGRSLIRTLDGTATDSAIIQGSTSLSIVGTSGSSNFGDELSQTTMGSFVEGAPGNFASCGSVPGNVLDCWDMLNLAFPRAATVSRSTESYDQRALPDEVDPNQSVAETQVPRQSSAATPMAFILLMGGLAAAGFAGWRAFLKGRRFTKTRRRDASRRRRSGHSVF